MFKVGDRVVYPLQGAGTIEAIEEHKIVDKTQKYYVIRLAAYDMKIMVPVELEDKVGLRKIVEKNEFESVFEILKGKSVDIFLDWKERYTTNLEKMKTGSISNVAEVARCLSERGRIKTLSIVEKRLYDNACTSLATELSYVHGIRLDEADSMVKNLLKEARIEERKETGDRQ